MKVQVLTATINHWSKKGYYQKNKKQNNQPVQNKNK